MKKILITGAKGFLGSNAVEYFKGLGYETYGIGHGRFSVEELNKSGLDHWKESDVSVDSILEFKKTFDVILHCAGGGSVSYSMEYPDEDFRKTVNGTIEVLEFIRLYNSNARLIYPSSPAVQGEHPDLPIKEEYVGKPASPYGYHKKIAEDYCHRYSKEYGLKISIVRLFSLYGNRLKKQLLWDACKKIRNSKNEVIFWGTGEETRDFIHITDALSLFDVVLNQADNFLLVNGGSGNRYAVRQIIILIRDLINPSLKIKFNNEVKAGDPIYYWADTENLQNYGFSTKKILEQEIKNYISWVNEVND